MAPWSCYPALEMHLPRITEMSGEVALTRSRVQPDTGVFSHQPVRKHVEQINRADRIKAICRWTSAGSQRMERDRPRGTSRLSHPQRVAAQLAFRPRDMGIGPRQSGSRLRNRRYQERCIIESRTDTVGASWEEQLHVCKSVILGSQVRRKIKSPTVHP